jgi:hypothetical protein
MNRGDYMMDLIMIGTLIVGFASVKLFTEWCSKQIEKK